ADGPHDAADLRTDVAGVVRTADALRRQPLDRGGNGPVGGRGRRDARFLREGLMKLERGDVGMARFPHAGGTRGKKRPVVVVQANAYNAKLRHVIVAEATTNLAAAADPASLLIEVS